MGVTEKQPEFTNLWSPDYGRPPKVQHQPLQDLTKPHIDSFNYMIREGLAKSVRCMQPLSFKLKNGDIAEFSVVDVNIFAPEVPSGNYKVSDTKVYPAECRQRGTSYKGRIQVKLLWKMNGEPKETFDKMLGEVPVMVKSDVCHLSKMSPKELVAHGEEVQEMGGYFIINGIEKIIRMLIMPRRNYPLAIVRPSWAGKGQLFTSYGVTMRCVRTDQRSANIVLHYLDDGSTTVCFTHSKEQFFVPVIMILKILVMDKPDKFIYGELIKGKESDSYYKGCIQNMFQKIQGEGLGTPRHILEYLGERFRMKLQLPEFYSDFEVGKFLKDQCICIHLDNDMDKFDCLILMTRKLYTFAKGECSAESADNPMFQEILLGGHLYQMVLAEKIENWLLSLKYAIEKVENKGGGSRGTDFTLNHSSVMRCVSLSSQSAITNGMEYLLATGNLISKSGLGLMQATGLTVVADKLNFFRYVSHFRCVHRGAFFAQMRTTAVRKLLPEAWGFLCPVHTPDGTPCGLLNHMSASCQTVTEVQPFFHASKILGGLGMTPCDCPPPGPYIECYPVMLDGKVIGWIHKTQAQDAVNQLRYMKVMGIKKVPDRLEIGLVPMTDAAVAGQYPGLFLFTTVARMVRPVLNLRCKKTEMIGSFEQVFMDICITPNEAYEGITTHQELSEDVMLSTIACLTPYSDFNQSPRNMYQCQMAKQTMGTPCHTLTHRSDNKLYRILTPQTPMVRPYKHDHYQMDEYPLGTNAVVAVLSYTGYDMEDAMIINKGSYDRGFAHGCVYKSEFVDLGKLSGERSRITLMFGNKEEEKHTGKLDADGFPPIGTYLQQGDPYYSYINVQTGIQRVSDYKSMEPGYLQSIKICGNDSGTSELQKVCITLRIVRNPIIGDKFSSRHGQKGVCSKRWPVEDMPFTEGGMTPDILFNPHGYPSRMTIGMMIESMAGKSAAMHGLCHDATPFTFSEDRPAIDYFGRMLTSAGYNYYGTERLFSGIDGREMEADIFIGVVYYQRLRHMVSDKFQVRTTGPLDQVTHQPVKGRKRAGGVRFGEMERDGLISHGASFLLQDRLLNCSDRAKANVCTKCGCILSPYVEKQAPALAAISSQVSRRLVCALCNQSDTIESLNIPYIFQYLCAELAAMNIHAKLDVTSQQESRKE
ncbi:DNA-directed RNA polymerase I subunit RPA2-like [Lineus longissimus]|uniref:DNA-directed RNA polymerase I subunit RPA2-like n=1 Tax=Lineus longissimus TaxID=88925 RepID=UPI002B4EC331